MNTTYSVSVTNVYGCSSTDEVVVFLGNQLKPSAGQDASICKGEQVTIFPSGGASYVWNTLEKTNQLTVAPLVTTVYTVTAFDNMNCSGTDQVIVRVNTPSMVEAGFPKAICIGDETMLIANGAIYYTWNANTMVNYTKVSPQTTTTYTVTGTDVNGCTSTDNTVVQVYDLPHIDAGRDTAICLGQAATLKASGGYTYTCSNQFVSNSFTVSPKKTTAYSVTATDIHGCSNTDDIVVEVMGLPVVKVGADTSVCEGQPARLSAFGGKTYLWSNGGVGAEQFVYPKQTTKYMVTVTDTHGCSSKKGMTVRLLYAPQATTSDEVMYCSHDAAKLVAEGGDSYIWNTGETTKTIYVKPELATVYTVTVHNYAGCSDTSEVVVRLYDLPIAEAGSTTTVCYMGQGLLSASGGVLYAWNNGAKTANTLISPLVDSYYTVTVTDNHGCTASDNVAVEVIALPEEPTVSDVIACLNEDKSVHLAVYSPRKNLTYQWYTLLGDFLHQGEVFKVDIAANDSATIYWVESVNSNHCASASRVKGTIHYGLIPSANFVIDSALAFVNEPLHITNLSIPEESIISYQWHMGDGFVDENNEPIYTYPQAGLYSIGLVVTSVDLCTDTLFKKDAMRIVDFPNLFIPTAFSPNEDGKNDYFRAYGEVTQYYMQIFNQWGVKLYETIDQYPGWDGTRHGKDQPTGNYVYIVEVVGKSGEKIYRNGVVTLTR